jgi:hypothetical protein
MRYYLSVSIESSCIEDEIQLKTYLYKLDEIHLMAEKIKELSELNSEEISIIMRISYEPI